MKMFTVAKIAVFEDDKSFVFSNLDELVQEDKGTVVWDIVEYVPNSDVQNLTVDIGRATPEFPATTLSDASMMLSEDWGIL